MKKKRLLTILLSAWLLAACLKTAPVTPTIEPMEQAEPTQAATPAGPDGQPTQPVSAGATPLPTQVSADSSPLFPGLDLVLEGGLPAGPQTANLYEFPVELIASDATARSAASSLGVKGEVYGSASATGGHWVFDGGKRFWKSGSQKFFDLYLLPPMLLPAAQCAAPCLPEGAETRVERFLKDSNHFGFDHNIQPSPTLPHQVDIFQLLDGAPLISPYGPAATVLTDNNGDPIRVHGREIALEPGRAVRLISAAEAWQALKDGPAGVISTNTPRAARRRAPGTGVMPPRATSPPMARRRCFSQYRTARKR